MPLALMPLVNRAARASLVRSGARSRMVEAQGHRVHLMDVPGRGEGPPLVLFHGLGSSGLTYSRIIPGLSQFSSRVLSADLPGSGFSPVPERPLSLEATVRFLAALYAQELGGQPAVVFGNSLGGGMALTLAAERPELVRGLVLSSPAGAKVKPERFDQLVRSFDMHSATEGARFVRRLYHRAPRIVPFLLGAEIVDNFHSAAVKEYLGGERPANHIEPEQLAKLAMPVLLLWGRSEKLLPYESLDYFRAHLPRHAVIEEVDGFGHSPHLESAERVVERVRQFVDTLPKSSGAGLP